MIWRWLLAIAALAASLIIAAAAWADDFRPAYLQITQDDAITYEVLWKVPALGEDAVLRIHPAFPSGTTDLPGLYHRTFKGLRERP